MISTWWLHLLDVLGHYVILPGAVAHIVVITNNIMKLGYTYIKSRLKNFPEILRNCTHRPTNCMNPLKFIVNS